MPLWYGKIRDEFPLLFAAKGKKRMKREKDANAETLTFYAIIMRSKQTTLIIRFPIITGLAATYVSRVTSEDLSGRH